MSQENQQLYTILVFSENIAGLLNQITAVFTRRQVNIESLNVSASSTPGVHKYTITCYCTLEMVKMLKAQIEKRIDVLQARFFTDDDIFICCYLTDDKRVRFGIFGRLLPNGEKITLDARTTEVIKYETEYQATPLLAHGATNVLQPGRNGYKAEAYKVRWDADGNQLSRELLCKSFYKVKNEIVQYGA